MWNRTHRRSALQLGGEWGSRFRKTPSRYQLVTGAPSHLLSKRFFERACEEKSFSIGIRISMHSFIKILDWIQIVTSSTSLAEDEQLILSPVGGSTTFFAAITSTKDCRVHLLLAGAQSSLNRSVPHVLPKRNLISRKTYSSAKHGETTTAPDKNPQPTGSRKSSTQV
ncbi:hypothetical protein CDAR_275521 [Caerostris darwini]|uniref:Uncharacterized protein n=1 Tax=Caerostris darwini TaxID=1538125 RepID=A0AAV4UM81_9ARAC|nr:hypothetical protein CDAR_275521 [Caerostris darwini]